MQSAVFCSHATAFWARVYLAAVFPPPLDTTRRRAIGLRPIHTAIMLIIYSSHDAILSYIVLATINREHPSYTTPSPETRCVPYKTFWGLFIVYSRHGP